MEEGNGRALLEVAEALRLRTGQLVRALEMLPEIALREEREIETILAGHEIRRIVEGGGSAPRRAGDFMEKLRALRYPRLSAALERLNAEVAELKLPRQIVVRVPTDLSSNELALELRVRSAAELGTVLETLQQRRPGLVRLLELLGGAGTET